MILKLVDQTETFLFRFWC